MDVEQFVELVRERPCLYDNEDPMRKMKKEREKMWLEIATAMEITSDHAKNKWKNLKDNYIRHLKGVATGGYHSKYLHWPWVHNMEFMKKHLNFLSTTTIEKVNNHDENVNIDSESSIKSDEKSEDLGYTINMAREGQLKSTHKVYDYKDNTYDGFDATDLIFLGYAKTIQEFSVRRQAEIKMKLAKLILEEELAHHEEISGYPQSPCYFRPSSPQSDPLCSKLIQVKTEEF